MSVIYHGLRKGTLNLRGVKVSIVLTSRKKESLIQCYAAAVGCSVQETRKINYVRLCFSCCFVCMFMVERNMVVRIG